jgi:UDP:flavonoid glycosyltransferase YjiC (YdhE family)
MRRALLHVLDKHVFDPVIAPRLNAFRSEIGLPPVRRVLREWIHSPQMVIGMFPEWFAKPQPDWPRNTHLTGFPFSDPSEGASELPPDVMDFLARGEPPVVFTLGTAMTFARTFFEVSAEVCRKTGRRGIFLTQFPDQVPAQLPPQVRHFSYVPFGRLLPRTAALVHHGGIGTVAQALAAGVPQLITPFNFDQPDNAARVRRLGAGDSLRPGSYTAPRVSRRLEALLTSPSVAEKCRNTAAKLRENDAVQHTCRLIESLACVPASLSQTA